LTGEKPAKVQLRKRDFPQAELRERFGRGPDPDAGLIAQPDRLLEVSGQITRVGISDEALGGFVDLGVEIQSGAQRRVMLLQGQDWAVWRLRSLLEGKPSAARGSQRSQEASSAQ